MKIKLTENQIKMNIHLRDKRKEGACSQCGKQYPLCMKWLIHHDESNKQFAIGGSMLAVTPEILAKELAKCVLICAECGHKRNKKRSD